MIKPKDRPQRVVKCSTCGKPVVYKGSSEGTSFPFCSGRCQMIDLDKWFEGDYNLSRPFDPQRDDDVTR